jgi:hypothetical protein
MIKAILPLPNQPQCVVLEVDDAYTARFWAHHFEVQMDNAVHQFQIWLQNELDLTLGFIWADAMEKAKE